MRINPVGLCALATGFLTLAGAVHAMDVNRGEMNALPVPPGQAPAIDGDLADWNLAGSEPVYISEATARRQHADWAVLYDDDALYIGVRMTMPGRPFHNANNPRDAFWQGDLLQARLAVDPALPYPLHRERDKESDRVAHLSFWKNTDTGIDYLHIARGTDLKRGDLVNPEGSAIVLRAGVGDDGQPLVTAEVRIGWGVLGVEDGKNPYKPGDALPFVIETLWVGGDSARVAANFRRNPGMFAFRNTDTWGQLRLLAEAPAQPLRPSWDEIYAGFGDNAPVLGDRAGAALAVDIPEDGLKTSVNILGPDGAVLRELAGGLALPAGQHTFHWNGRDAWGHPVAPGAYRWGAYMHRGLDVEFMGTVGSSGQPPYRTAEGRGGWGADHANPIDAAADASGTYLLWSVAEAGRNIVKVGHDGNVLWRKTPFIGGGFGPFFAMAADGRHVYLARGTDEVFLARLDAATGALLAWSDNGPSEIAIGKADLKRARADAVPMEVQQKNFIHRGRKLEESVLHPNAAGMATDGKTVWLSMYGADGVLEIDAADGRVRRTLPLAGPRGLAVGPDGALFAVAYTSTEANATDGADGAIEKTARVVRFAPGAQTSEDVVVEGLDAPYGLAVDGDGRLYVSDLGAAQCIKTFGPAGRPGAVFGRPGGRPWQGRYDPDAFLMPSGLAWDPSGALVVTESSPPKVFSRIDPLDGRVLSRGYGPGVYWNSTFPMPDDPTHVFFILSHALGRARLPADPDGVGVPDAYWDPARAGYPEAGDLSDGFPQPGVLRADNGRLYLVKDANPHVILIMDEAEQTLRPMASWNAVRDDHRLKIEKPRLDVWIDANGDGLAQDGERRVLDILSDGTALPRVATKVGSMMMRPNGDLYFVTEANRILRVPADGFEPDGRPRWKVESAHTAIPEVIPGFGTHLPTTWRHGLVGVDMDGEGNFYVTFNARFPGQGGPVDYPDPATAKRMLEGMGHSASFNATKIAKFRPDGTPVWMAGRKATGGARPGEVYHWWNLAGLVGDHYVAGGSEWGTIHFYTHDGYFVDTVMNDPGQSPPPGPATFGGETSGARVVYFPERDEVWAYSTARAFRVRGFTKGRIDGERRLHGTVQLDAVLDETDADNAPAAPWVWAALPAANGADTPDARWRDVPSVAVQRDGREVARAQAGYDAERLHFRIRVKDATPLVNHAEGVELAFAGGDAAGVVFGPAPAPDAKADAPTAGSLRLLAARIGGRDVVVAMKPTTRLDRRPFTYETPATGAAAFAFVGEVPGAEVAFVADAEGYTATFSVPRAFVEAAFAPGTRLMGDVDLRLSGEGGRGGQATERLYHFTPRRPQTSMTNDIPTEARLYPRYWSEIQIR